MVNQPKIGIIGGKGKMGSLFADLFAQQGYQVIISDLETKLTNKMLAKQADVILVSVPMEKTIKVIEEIAPLLNERQLLLDFTSLKKEPVNAMLQSHSAVIGLHPMFNNTSFGPGQTVIICPARPKKWLSWLQNLLSDLRLNYAVLTPSEHDKIMSIVQGLIHFAEVSFIRALEKNRIKIAKIIPFASPAYAIKLEMAARILAQDPDLYANIAIQNPENRAILNHYLSATQELKEIIFKKDLPAYRRYFQSGAMFLGKYKEKALQESDWLINKMLQKNTIKLNKIETTKKADLGLIGPKLTYSDMAADQWIKKTKSKNSTKNYYATIEQVCEAVKKNEVKTGIIPIETTMDGTIKETLDGLFFNDLKIIQELSLPIHHCLAVLPDAQKEDISAVISKAQALNACGKYLKQHFKNAELINFVSTTVAMEKIIDEKQKHIAVIGPQKAAQTLGLKILAEKIEDHHHNKTTFVVISKNFYKLKAKSYKLQAKQKTSLAFYFGENRPGILFGVFKDFASANINLTRIESRPSRKEFGDYIFYLDFQGGAKDPRAQKVLKNIANKVAKLKIFGSYPY